MSYRIENIVRKGEIACYKQFLLFSQCFPLLDIFSVVNGQFSEILIIYRSMSNST